MAEPKSIFDIIDDTLHDVGLPGLKDILPSPKEVAGMVGIPTPGELASRIKADIKRRVEAYKR